MPIPIWRSGSKLYKRYDSSARRIDHSATIYTSARHHHKSREKAIMRSASPSTLRSLLLARNILSRKPSRYSTTHNHLSRINSSSSFTPFDQLFKNPVRTKINSLICPWFCTDPIHARLLSTTSEWPLQQWPGGNERDDASGCMQPVCWNASAGFDAMLYHL